MSCPLLLIEDGRVDPTMMTTHTFAFEDVEEAYHLMDTKGDGTANHRSHSVDEFDGQARQKKRGLVSMKASIHRVEDVHEQKAEGPRGNE